MSIPKESEEQEDLAAWLDAIGVMWCHVANGAGLLGGRKDGAKFGKIAALKRQGVKVGVCDVLVFTPPPLFPEKRGAASELKRRPDAKGRISHCAEFTLSQRMWLADMGALGWCVDRDENGAVKAHYGARAAIAWLESLGYGRRS
jgi:hypothetical protein